MTDRVHLRREGAVAHIELNRTERRNALDAQTATEFLGRCREVAADGSIRAVVLCGAGATFGVGGDLSELAAGGGATARRIIEALHEAVALLAKMKAPTIAKLQGHIAGGSMSLALACDLALAAESTRFTFAYTNIGTTPDLGGSWHLPRLVGLRRAMELALLNATLSARQACDWGLVNKVVPLESLDAEVSKLAARLAGSALQAVGNVKALLQRSFGRHLEDHMAAELASFLECAQTSDFAEGIAAVIEKRQPRFRGC